MSQDALSLCAHIFFRVSHSPVLSLSLSAALSIAPSPSPFPTGDLFFLLWDLRSHSLIAHYSALIPPEDGPREAEWVAAALSPPYTSPPYSSLIAMRWCHGFYLLQGYPFIFSLYYTVFISLSPPPSISFTSVILSQSLSQILLPLKRRLEDLGMFGCCLAHPRTMLDTQTIITTNPTVTPLKKSHWFNIPLLLLHLPVLSSAFVFSPVI